MSKAQSQPNSRAVATCKQARRQLLQRSPPNLVTLLGQIISVPVHRRFNSDCQLHDVTKISSKPTPFLRAIGTCHLLPHRRLLFFRRHWTLMKHDCALYTCFMYRESLASVRPTWHGISRGSWQSFPSIHCISFLLVLFC